MKSTDKSTDRRDPTIPGRSHSTVSRSTVKRKASIGGNRNTPPPRTKVKAGFNGNITGAHDQFMINTYVVNDGKCEAVIRQDEASKGPANIARVLSLQNMPCANPAKVRTIAAQLDLVDDFDQAIYVARTPGVHRYEPDKYFYVRLNGNTPPDRPEHFYVALDRPVLDLGKRGGFNEWQEAVKTFASGQPIIIIALCVSFVGIISGFMGWPNPVLEIYGPSSRGKTKVLDLAASVWGAPLRTPGSIAVSLRTTVAAVEEALHQRNGAFFAGDEVHLFGYGKRGADIANLLLTLAEGVENSRYNNPAAPRASLSCALTSNNSIVELVGERDRSAIEPLLVRLISVQVPDESNGVFHHVPAGFASSREAIVALEAATAAHYGHAAAKFIKVLWRRLRDDPEALRAQIGGYAASFVESCHVERDDNIAFRRAQLYSTLYAAGKLGIDLGILPIERIGNALRDCYRREIIAHRGLQIAQTAMHRVAAYVADQGSNLRELDNHVRLPTMTRQQLNAHPGFLKTRLGTRCLCIRRRRLNAVFGPQARQILRELDAAGRLQKLSGFINQVRVRRDVAKDRMVVIIL